MQKESVLKYTINDARASDGVVIGPGVDFLFHNPAPPYLFGDVDIQDWFLYSLSLKRDGSNAYRAAFSEQTW